MFIKRFFAFVISVFLIFYPAYAYANTSFGGWTLTDSIIAGANTTINATKKTASGALKSAVTVGSSATKVGGHLIRGGGSVAVAFALVELADGAIDWVLDPANNAIKYKPVPAPAPSVKTYSGDPAPAGYYWVVNNSLQGFYTPEAACADQPWYGVIRDKLSYYRCWSATLNNEYPVALNQTATPAADSDVDADGYKSIPIDNVASQVIANAEAGHPESQEVLKAAAIEGFVAGDYDADLEASAIPLTAAELAAAESAAELAAAEESNGLLDSILASITGFFDWVKAPVPPEEEKKPVPFGTVEDVGLDSVDRYEQRITFSGQCPSSDFSFSMLGVTYAKPIPYHHLCGFLEQIAPWLLAMCYLGTAYFVVENV